MYAKNSSNLPTRGGSLEHFVKMSIRPRLLILQSLFQVRHFGGGGQNGIIIFKSIFEEKEYYFLAID
jgi:hypothetical protein